MIMGGNPYSRRWSPEGGNKTKRSRDSYAPVRRRIEAHRTPLRPGAHEFFDDHVGNEEQRREGRFQQPSSKTWIPNEHEDPHEPESGRYSNNGALLPPGTSRDSHLMALEDEWGSATDVTKARAIPENRTETTRLRDSPIPMEDFHSDEAIQPDQDALPITGHAPSRSSSRGAGSLEPGELRDAERLNQKSVGFAMPSIEKGALEDSGTLAIDTSVSNDTGSATKGTS